MKYFCRQSSRLASDRLERSLSLAERFSLWLHCSMCSMCRHHAHFLRVLGQTCSHLHEEEPNLPLSLAEKRKRAIRAGLQKALTDKQ